MLCCAPQEKEAQHQAELEQKRQDELAFQRQLQKMDDEEAARQKAAKELTNRTAAEGEELVRRRPLSRAVFHADNLIHWARVTCTSAVCLLRHSVICGTPCMAPPAP